MYQHVVVNTCCISCGVGVIKALDSKVILKVTHGDWHLCPSISETSLSKLYTKRQQFRYNNNDLSQMLIISG